MANKLLLLSILENLEAEMKHIDLWDSVPLPASAFESELPFFYDTMTFPQWLQWVFIERFKAIIEGGHTLPSNCQVAPMAEEYFKQVDVYIDPIVGLLKRFDREVS